MAETRKHVTYLVAEAGGAGDRYSGRPGRQPSNYLRPGEGPKERHRRECLVWLVPDEAVYA